MPISQPLQRVYLRLTNNELLSLNNIVLIEKTFVDLKPAIAYENVSGERELEIFDDEAAYAERVNRMLKYLIVRQLVPNVLNLTVPKNIMTTRRKSLIDITGLEYTVPDPKPTPQAIPRKFKR